MTDALADVTRPQVQELQHQLSVLGSLQSISYKRVGSDGADVFDVKFANGDSTWSIFVTPEGKLTYLSLQPAS